MLLAVCADNNSVISAPGIMPFNENYGYHTTAGTVPREANTLWVRLGTCGDRRLAVFENYKKEVENPMNKRRCKVTNLTNDVPRLNLVTW
jgi:hypothetical protein